MIIRICCVLVLAIQAIPLFSATANDVVAYNGVPGSGRTQIYAHRAGRGLMPELRNYDVGRLKPGTQYASYFPYQRSVDLTPIPTLKEVVQFVKKIAGDKVGFQIEIKNDPTQAELTASPKDFAKALYQLMAEENISDRAEIQEFDWRCLIELNKLDKHTRPLIFPIILRKRWMTRKRVK